jgi:muramidase (phage lysozyme)
VASPDLLRPSKQKSLRQRRSRSGLPLLVAGTGLMVALWVYGNPITWFWRIDPDRIAPLAMQGGDPYVRALMRTISASEANDPSPYTILYGGSHVQDLSRHPDTCVTIVNGPNQGRCTTAAGRYQFLTSTWEEKARLYHPQTGQWAGFNFAPEYQDQVVYAWLTDQRAWGVNIPQLLQEGQIHQVLEILSPTWTSLGYGIENNLITPSLSGIYQDMLKEERER